MDMIREKYMGQISAYFLQWLVNSPIDIWWTFHQRSETPVYDS
jgi:hypothetical protein